MGENLKYEFTIFEEYNKQNQGLTLYVNKYEKAILEEICIKNSFQYTISSINSYKQEV